MKKNGVFGVYIAEISGVYEGLRLATRLRFRAIDINVDSQQVESDVNTNRSNNIMGKNLITKIRSCMPQDLEIRINHVYR